MSYSSEVLADAPLVYWRLGESSGSAVADSSGAGRNGTFTVGTYTRGVTGLLAGDTDKATLFPGNSKCVVASATWMNNAAFSVDVLVKPSSIGPADRFIVGRNDTDGDSFAGYVNMSWRLVLDPSGAPRFDVFTGTYTAVSATSSIPLVAGQTAHVAASCAGGVLRVYVNGVQAGTGSYTDFQWSVYCPMSVGAYAGFGSGNRDFFDGVIDEVAYYGTALSAARVAAHYDAVSAGGGTPSATSTLSGTQQRESAAFNSVSVDLPPTSTLAATQQRDVAAFVSEGIPVASRETSLVAREQGQVVTFTGRAITPVVPTPPLVGGTPAEAAGRSVVVAKAHGPVTMNGTQPVYAVSKAETPRARQQIVVDGVDVTYFRGVRTPDVDYTLLEPLLYGPGNLELPQVVAWAETFGAGDLHWLRPQAPVEVNLVVDDVVVVRDVWKGFIAAFDESGATLSVELGGEANGRAAMRDRQNPIFPRINDVGHQIADAVRDLGLPHNPPLGAVTGIEMMTTGGTGHLDHINDLVAKSWTRSGKQWTVMPDPSTGVYETHRKDATTIHATAFLDAVHTVGRLRRDIAEEPNQIFVTCVTPAGMRVRFGKYPGLVQGPVPDFPGSMSEGDTGEGVRLLVGKLHASGYLKLADVAGGFDDDVVEAVKQLQDDAGLPETGVVNLATWRALYDLDVTGLSLEWANIQPAAQRSKTRKFDRSANGTIVGFNDEYDPEVIIRHRTIDLGSGITRRQAREFARTVLHDSDAPNWVGDITFNTGALIRGEGSVGMTLAPADVMDARELRPGMNLWLPQHDGGTLVHVSACQVNGDGIVTATVDTRFRDAMEVWEVIARNKESRNDPSRHRARRYRASTIVKDSIGEWDEFGGMLGVDLPLERGWNKFPVVAAMEGQIRELVAKLKDPAEFAIAVFGREFDEAWLTDLVPNPLTVSGTKAWESKQNALDENWLLYSAGTHDEPCGYWPGRKKWKSVTGEESNPDYNPTADENTTGTDDQETVEVTTSESFGTVTGKYVDSAGFPYFSADRKVIWVAIWVRSPNTLPLGRIMKPQLEAGV